MRILSILTWRGYLDPPNLLKYRIIENSTNFQYKLYSYCFTLGTTRCVMGITRDCLGGYCQDSLFEWCLTVDDSM